MKKGIVMEIHRKYAILLTKDGSFEKGIILTEHAERGDEVIFQPVSGRPRWRRYWDKTPIAVRLSAVVLLMLLIFGYPLFYGMGDTETHAYVAIDINPSIELELNDELMVTDVNALNSSADKLLEEINSIQDKPIHSVLTHIVDESENRGLAEQKTMIVGVSCENQNGNPRELISQINPYIETLHDWDVATLIIPEEVREVAKNENKSMNEVMATELANRNVDIEQTHFDMTDADDRAIINFFYGEQESDINRSIKQEKTPIKPKDNELTDDVSDDKDSGQDESL